MKTDLPPWLARFVAPILVGLALLEPVLKIWDLADEKHVLAAAVATTLAAAAWSWNVWRSRIQPTIYGSQQRPFRFSSLTRYGSIVGFATCLAATAYLSLPHSRGEKSAIQSIAVKQLPFTVYNSVPRVPIWMPATADIEVLSPASPRTEAIVATARARVEMPGVFKFGKKPQIDPNESKSGFIVLPERFDLQQYMNRGLTSRILVQVEPGGRLLQSEVLLDDLAVKEGFELVFAL